MSGLTFGARANIVFVKAVLPADLERLVAFDRAAFAQTVGDAFGIDAWTELECHWMVVDGVTVGCSALERNIDHPGVERLGCLYIASTAIAPEHRGKGYGLVLKRWQIAFGQAEGFDAIVGCTRASNVAMRTMYERLGFSMRPLDEHYYADPDESALVAELPLRERIVNAEHGVSLETATDGGGRRFGTEMTRA